MTYEEAREFIQKSNQYGSVLGLETITELLRRLDNPQEKLKIIHVAGTNGKGSTSAYIATILAFAGYRIGRYLSPTVFSYRERIQTVEVIKKEASLRTEYITREGVSKAIGQIKSACEAMVKEGYAHPTSFEIETAMTFLYLLWQNVDFLVLEVGLGGRLDATNVIRKPVCSVITSISMDHMQFLGDTLRKIASEKAGIIKNGAPVVTCEQNKEVIQVLEQKAKELGSELNLANSEAATEIDYSMDGTEFIYHGIPYQIKLLGEYQIKNAVLALEAAGLIEKAGYPIRREALQKGLLSTEWRGRFEVISKKPYVIIDGAHNEDAARTLRRSIEIYFTNRRIIYIIGVLADKDYKSILEITAPLADRIYTLTPENSRALASDQLADTARAYCQHVYDAVNADQAITLALQEAGEKDVIIAFGSLSYLGELVNALRIRKDEENVR